MPADRVDWEVDYRTFLGDQHTMPLTSAQKKQFRSIGHHLSPIVQVSENGLSAGAVEEVKRALADHELIKVKLMSGERDERAAQIEALIEQTRAELVQTIGKIALLYRRNREGSKLSNVTRFSV